jgi:hypothetical protein
MAKNVNETGGGQVLGDTRTALSGQIAKSPNAPVFSGPDTQADSPDTQADGQPLLYIYRRG